MNKINILKIKNKLELSQMNSRCILKDLAEVQTSISEYKQTLESLLHAFTEMDNQLEEDTIDF